MDINRVTHLDMGCGPAGTRVGHLLSQGVQTCMGVDVDLTRDNEDFLALNEARAWLAEEHSAIASDLGLDVSPRFEPERHVKEHLIEVEAIDVLALMMRGQLKVIFDDYFLNNLCHQRRLELSERVNRVLASGGRIISTQDVHDIQLVEDMFLPAYEIESRTENYELITIDQRMRKAVQDIVGTRNIQTIYRKM